MSRTLRLPLAILAILLFGIVGVVLVRVAANEKAHTVHLNWDAPAPKPGSTVAGYNVYRSQPDGTYTQIASGIPGTSYIDSDVKHGKTYHYFVRAVDTAGHESPFSNPAAAVIP